jgi:3-phenylpropionate/trans-cinnamate dioxygenase ferredoxin reductase subunit
MTPPPSDETTPNRVVIVGANMAGASAAEALRREGFQGRILLLGAESLAPYERPPLSKGYLLGTTAEAKLVLRPTAFYAELGIELRLGARATALHVDARVVELEGGERVGFDRLLIGTGSEVRRLDVPGAHLSGIHYLRTLADAQALLAELPGARVAVVGAGFIGAEVAAACRSLGHAVTMIEPLAAPMERALGHEIGGLLARVHREKGVELRLGEGVVAFRGARRVEEVETTAGARIPCDLAVVGVGVRPATDWLRGAGIALENGVVVDRFCATRAPGIYAAGDVATWPYQLAGAASATRVRMEHYDNALRQGEAAARNMLGQETPYAPVPYFWSDQYDLQLQMVGYAPAWDQMVLRGSIEARSLAAFYLAGGRLRAVMLINRVRDLGPVRRLVAAGAILDPTRLADDTMDVRRLISNVP